MFQGHVFQLFITCCKWPFSLAEDAGSFLRKVSVFLEDYMASNPTKQNKRYCSYSQLRETLRARIPSMYLLAIGEEIDGSLL